MKILALNSSPRTGGQSKTEIMLNSLVNGMREAGAEVEIVALREKKLKTVPAVSAVGPKHRVPVFTKMI